jgi:hypothetical protein
MRILFTRNNKSPFSRAIQWATDWDASHVAIEMEGMVFHSDLLGPSSELLEDFEKGKDIVREIRLENNFYDAIRLMHFYLKRKHRTYDFLLFISLGILLLLRKLKNEPLDKKLIHRVSGAYLCTEFVAEFIAGKENKYLLPEDIWEDLKTRQE